MSIEVTHDLAETLALLAIAAALLLMPWFVSVLAYIIASDLTEKKLPASYKYFFSGAWIISVTAIAGACYIADSQFAGTVIRAYGGIAFFSTVCSLFPIVFAITGTQKKSAPKPQTQE